MAMAGENKRRRPPGQAPRHQSPLTRRLQFLRRSELHDDVYAELVGILYKPLQPVIVISIALGTVGLVTSHRTHDPWTSLAALGVLIGVARMALILAFRRRGAKVTIDAAELSVWEKWYAAGSYAFATALGLFNYAVASSGHSLSLMLVTGLVFGYAAGLISRVSARPIICIVSVSLATIPTVAGFAMRGVFNGEDALVCDLQALFIFLFFISSFETILFNFRSVTTQLREKREFSNLARFDELTKLPNRLNLFEHFRTDAAAACTRGGMLFVHYLDLDGFKGINDRFGHPTGDALLKAVATRLSSNMRTGDTVSRLGGDEFVILQAGQQLVSEAVFLARRLLRDIAAPYDIDGQTIVVGISIGIAVYPQDGLSFDLLSARADQALYKAKRAGRGQVAFWNQDASATATEIVAVSRG